MSTTPPPPPPPPPQSQPVGPADPKEHRKSLGKYVKRMSSVFRRDKSTPSSSAAKGKASPSPTPAPAPAPVPAPAPAAAVDVPTREVATTLPTDPAHIIPDNAARSAAEPAAEPAAATLTVPIVATLQRSALQQERARALFAKYGFILESHEWIAAPAGSVTVQRVEKPIRMRVHRTCHRCGTTYGPDRVCLKCEHKRCKMCPRYPKKKTPADKADVQAKEAAVKALPKKKRVLTITTRDGAETVYQPKKQRVRRTCHKCQALFIPPTATICEACRHIRCTKCPREPAKLNKWPNGYPGDAEYDTEMELEREQERARRIWRKPRTRVRWQCEHCDSTFLDGTPQCTGCGHLKCDQCVRKPIKRVKVPPSFDPEVVKTVEDKLKKLHVHDDATSSTQAI